MKTRIRRWLRPVSGHCPADRRGLLAAAGLFLLLECFAVSCRKDPSDFATEKNPLRFSADTIFFDTIISTLNAPVTRFTITNPGKKPVKIDRIHIRPGESGYGQESFRFTVNGDTSAEIRDLVLYGHDSLFVFVRSGIRLKGQNEPFIVDAYFQCEIAESRSSQSVYLYAYGQDAHYWHADRVHVRPYTDTRQPGIVDTQYIPYFIWSPETHPIVAGDKPYAIFWLPDRPRRTDARNPGRRAPAFRYQCRHLGSERRTPARQRGDKRARTVQRTSVRHAL